MLDPSYIPQISELAQSADASARPDLWESVAGAWLPMCGESLVDVTGQADGVFGVIAPTYGPSCWVFPSTGGVVNVPHTARLNSAVVTLLVRLRQYTQASSAQVVMGKINTGFGAGKYPWELQNPATNFINLRVFDGSNAPAAALTMSVADGLMHTVVGTRGNGKLEIYLDGSKHGSVTDTANAANSQNTVKVGIGNWSDETSQNTGQVYSGQIHAAMVFDRVLSTDDIAAISADPILPFRRRSRRGVTSGSAITALVAASE